MVIRTSRGERELEGVGRPEAGTRARFWPRAWEEGEADAKGEGVGRPDGRGIGEEPGQPSRTPKRQC
jgi:hypothetical protein